MKIIDSEKKKKLKSAIQVLIIVVLPIVGIALGYYTPKLISSAQPNNRKIIEDYKNFLAEERTIKEIEKKAQVSLRKLSNLNDKSLIVDGIISSIYNKRDKMDYQIQAFAYDMEYLERKQKVDFNKADDLGKIKDKVIKAFVEEAQNSHLKFVKQNNQYYLIVDLDTILNKYGKYMNNDLKNILQIRKNEQDKPIYDVSSQEFNFDVIRERIAYMNEHIIDKSSPYYKQYIQYKTYYYDALFGKTHKMHLDEKGKIKEKVLKEYEKIAKEDKYLKDDMQKYLKVLKTNDYKINNNVEKYLEELFRQLQLQET